MSFELYDLTDRTDTGLVRKGNEDAIAFHVPTGLVVVADGMGGCAAGEVASQMAVEEITAHVLGFKSENEEDFEDQETALSTAFQSANHLIWQESRQERQLRGMGTTAVAGLFGTKRLSFAHVGDSRLYRFRQKSLECLTRDHSLIQESVDDGLYSDYQSASSAGVSSNILTRALGISTQVDVDVSTSEILSGDIYLLCTDGLYNMLSYQEMESEMRLNSSDLDDLADSMLEQACFNGGEDNVSFVLIRRN